MNIFLSFSGTSRETFAIKFLDFFNKYGVHCWYDQHELLLGDMLKDTIIEKGLETADYCILIIKHILKEIGLVKKLNDYMRD